MKISIVTISYNQAKFLEEAIASVLNQDYPIVEYIVVDAGSSDGSHEIIQKYADNCHRVIFEPDQGPADGLNKGFSVATGDIFGFLNSDDVLEPGALARVARFFTNHPSVDIVSGHSWIIDANGRRKRRIYSDRYSLKMAAYNASILSQASTFFRSKQYHKVGGLNPQNRLSWDGELFLDMALAGARFAVVPEFWSAFRVYAESISGSGITRDLTGKHMTNTYKKVMGREPGLCYPLEELLARYVRKILNPADTWERIRRGPVTSR